MTPGKWCAAIFIGVGIASVLALLGSRLIPVNEAIFDRLPQSDKETLTRAWGNSRSARSGRLLLHAAKDPSAQVRQTAAYVLRQRCDVEDGMIALLDTNQGYNAGLMNALAECRSQKAIPVLIKYLENLDRPGPAGVAAESLEKIGGAGQAVPQLIAAATSCDELCSARAAAALSAVGEQVVSRRWAIGKLSIPEPARHDPSKLPDWMIRQYAIRILGRIGKSSDIPVLEASLARPGVLKEEADTALAAIRSREVAK